MSSTLDKMVPVFTGSNWQQWHTSMQAYLQAQGQWFVYSTTQPTDGHNDRNNWDDCTERALGNITLHLAPSIQVTVADLTTVKEVWDYLKKSFGAPSIGSAYAELSKLLSMTIPTGSHPAPAITKMLSHFTYLKDAGFDFPAPMQTMIILCKLPPTMEVVAQILSQTSLDEIKNLKPEGIVKAAMLLFEQKGATRSGGKGPQANKLSAVKRKPADPKFAQQQQQQQGRSNGGVSGNVPAQGQGGRTRRGSKKARTRRKNAQQATFATYVYYNGPEPTVDPCALAHTPCAAHYGPPAFDNTIKAFDLAHHLGVEPSCQTIRTLDHIVSMASVSLDQPKASPSSLKHPCLEECITMYEEDAISLGDDEPIAHEPFADDEFNEIDVMVLDRYNAMSMAMDAEASLFRQVPSARMLTDTDTLPLHVLYMPALYIVSSHYSLSCHVSSNAYICSCSNNVHCAGCKGKMANDSELSGAFWLLDSGASCHFTGDIGNFASYNALKRAHYTKTANGVALIAGIGTVLLWCLDHNSGDEKVITLTQVLHMPGTTACLISMGEMLQHNYKVTGNKRGISLTHKAECLWFEPDPEDDRNVIFGIRSILIIRSNYIASVSKIDYDIMHWRFGHPSKEIVKSGSTPVGGPVKSG